MKDWNKLRLSAKKISERLDRGNASVSANTSSYGLAPVPGEELDCHHDHGSPGDRGKVAS